MILQIATGVAGLCAANLGPRCAAFAYDLLSLYGNPSFGKCLWPNCSKRKTAPDLAPLRENSWTSPRLFRPGLILVPFWKSFQHAPAGMRPAEASRGSPRVLTHAGVKTLQIAGLREAGRVIRGMARGLDFLPAT